MINLNTEVAILAHDIDKPFDFALKQRIIAAYITGRTSLLRRSITSNKQIDSSCIQSFAMPVVKVPYLSLYNVDDYKISVKTRYRLPVNIRINNDTPFISVTSLDGSINFTYSDLASVRFNSNAGKFVSGTGRYILDNDIVALYHNEPTLASMSMVLFRGVFENPLNVKDYSNRYKYSIEMFPMPADMAYEIRMLILKGDLQIPPATQEITINDDK